MIHITYLAVISVLLIDRWLLWKAYKATEAGYFDMIDYVNELNRAR